MTMKMILLMMLLMIMMDGLEDDDDSDDDDAGGGGGGLTRPDVPPMLSNLGLQRLHLICSLLKKAVCLGQGRCKLHGLCVCAVEQVAEASKPQGICGLEVKFHQVA